MWWSGRTGLCNSTAGVAGAGQSKHGAVSAGITVAVSACPSTVSTVRFAVAAGLAAAAPSRATMAPPAWPRPGGTSMPAIARAGRTHEHTQHWPEHNARTNAPCHTPVAAPPGLATRPHRKPAPVGPYSEHEDENRDANCARGAARNDGVLVVVHVTRRNVETVRVVASGECERALVNVASPAPLPHSALASIPPSTPSFPLLRPITATLLHVAATPGSPPSFPRRGAVVCVIAEPAAKIRSVTHTTTSDRLVDTGSVWPNADVVAEVANNGKGPTPAFAGKPFGAAYSSTILMAHRSADSEEAAEYAAAALLDVPEDIAFSRANRDGSAHFHGDLSGSRSSKA